MSGLWCCNAGHSHPRIVEAIRRQAAELDYATAFQVGHPTAFKLAGRLAAMAPADLDAVFFTNSGSESVDTGRWKIALAYHHARGEPSRTQFVGRERGLPRRGFRRHERRWHRQQSQGVRGPTAGGCPSAADPRSRAPGLQPRPADMGRRTSPTSWNASSRSTTPRPSRRSSSNPSPDRQASWCRRWATSNGCGRSPNAMASC